MPTGLPNLCVASVLAQPAPAPAKPKELLLREGIVLFALAVVLLLLLAVGIFSFMRSQRRRLTTRRGPRQITSKISAWEIAGQRAEPATVDLDPPDDGDADDPEHRR